MTILIQADLNDMRSDLSICETAMEQIIELAARDNPSLAQLLRMIEALHHELHYAEKNIRELRQANT